jgi:primosomal replication protein N
MSVNHTELAGSLSEKGVLRHTPAGIPVIEFRVAHHSEQTEAGLPRQVECELVCVAVGTTALLLKEAPPGIELKVKGFIAARSLKHKMPVLHATAIEFEESIRTN